MSILGAKSDVKEGLKSDFKSRGLIQMSIEGD